MESPVNEWIEKRDPNTRTLRGWVNIYPDGSKGVYALREIADAEDSVLDAGKYRRIACVYVVQSYQIGDGIN